jgi:hypothetical protein
MNGQIQAAYWADDSDYKPEGLAKIASAIEEAATHLYYLSRKKGSGSFSEPCFFMDV